jgi:hypothetical protein
MANRPGFQIMISTSKSIAVHLWSFTLFCILTIGIHSVSIAQNPVPPSFIPQAGFYSEPVDIRIFAGSNDIIYYTLDGSVPDENSFIYNLPVTADYRTEEMPNLLYINRISHGYMTWAPPSGNEQLITVIRARSYRNGIWSRTITASYIIHPDGVDRYSLPVLSVATDSVNLFGHENGIYVLGKDFEDWLRSDPSHPGLDMTFRGGVAANYFRRGDDAEIPAHFEMFEPDGRRVLSQDIGVRVHGGLTRAMRLKSFRLYSRSDYGTSRFRYQIFPDHQLANFNRLILRQSGQDVNKTMFRDAMMQSLVSHLSFDTQAYRPSVLFINGEFWGIYNIRERYDRYYLSIKYGIDEDRIDLLTGNSFAKEGSNSLYVSLLNYVNNVRFPITSPEVYAEIRRRMDIQNFIEYQIANMYFNNRDWPQNNIDYWRYQAEGDYNPDATPPFDGRWRWMMFDTDFGFAWTDTHTEAKYIADVNFNTLERITRTDTWSTVLLRRLLLNAQFRHQFLSTYNDLLNSAFVPERVIERIDAMASVIDPHMQEHIDRMGFHSDRWQLPRSKSEWEDFIEYMRRFAKDRPEAITVHVMDRFGIPGQAQLSVSVNDTSMGYIRVNSLNIVESTPGVVQTGGPESWKGNYFKGVPIRVEAISASGSEFDYWIEYPDSGKVMTITPQTDITLSAIFQGTVSISDVNHAESVSSLILQQNYPNPFNPVTTISYELPGAGEVKLQVFDITGRVVSVLIDGRQQSGAHSITFSATERQLSSGIYIYRLIFEGRTETRRMTLVK